MRIPKFKLEDLEDYYTYLVLILGMSEDIFWNLDYSSVISIVENKTAYDNFLEYAKQKELERLNRRR